MELGALLADFSNLPSDWNGAIISAVKILRRVSKYSWVGIYAVEDGWLVLRAWEGPRATDHVRIRVGDGVCGSAALSGKTENVPDVSEDSRYIACFPETNSEIVVPIKVEGRVVGEIDIDSDMKGAFDRSDEDALERLAEELAKRYRRQKAL